ncbi:MAG: AmmeMemoRadiSam system radical SAM enzyme [Endomicrobia bacterium]|nr:AmmeMemoRadiSam system radical SAM enzyme [Endomicrobiia bacterium]
MCTTAVAIFKAIMISLFTVTQSVAKHDVITSATPKIKKEAMFYKKLSSSKVQCLICFRQCIIPSGARGACFNKENVDGTLYNIVYSYPSAVQIDPIEKEPMYHFLPSTNILCIGTAGCNFKCKHCHNWHLSQKQFEEITHYFLTPEEAVKLAKKYNIPSISFTYNDPIAFYEYIYDIARIAKKEKIKIIWHTNASINSLPLKEMLKFTDGITVDLKGFTEEFYKNQSLAKLQPVLNSLKIIKEHKNVWLEIVNLVIPTLNDNLEDIRNMCLWIKENLSDEVPLHFTRFYPTYKTTHLPATPISTLESCYKIAKDVGLKYVYIGNVPGHKYNSTYCPNCNKILIHRIHFEVLENNIEDGKCKFCCYKIAGVWRK